MLRIEVKHFFNVKYEINIVKFFDLFRFSLA